MKWNKVTWYSILCAIVLYTGTFLLSLYLGYELGFLSVAVNVQKPLINVAKFVCDDQKSILSAFYNRSVDLKLSDGRTFSLPQTISGSGVRYANADESFVFWNKGNTAFTQEESSTTYKNCVTE